MGAIAAGIAGGKERRARITIRGGLSRDEPPDPGVTGRAPTTGLRSTVLRSTVGKRGALAYYILPVAT